MSLEALQEKLRAMNETGEDVTEVIRQIALLKNQEQEQVFLERFEKSSSDNKSAFDSAQIEGFSIRELCAGEAQYQLLSLYFLTKMDEDAQKYLEEIRELEAEKRSQEEVVSMLRGDITSYKIKLEREVHDSTALRSEIISLQAKVEHLEESLKQVKSESKIPEFTNMNVSNYAKQLAEQIRASQIPVLAIETLDAKGSQIRVTHIDESVTVDSWLNRNKFRVVDEEEAGRFRSTSAASLEQSVESDTSAASLEVSKPMLATFPELEAVSGILEQTVGDFNEGSGEHPAALSLEERVSRLEERVAALEAVV
jgi:polyhydroxyalkanoate synthesis regulator phasin